MKRSRKEEINRKRERERDRKEGETDKWPADPALQKQLHSWPFNFSSLSSFQFRFIHFLIPRPFPTHSAVAMATPAAGDYSRYLLKPSLINAGLSHFRNDAFSGALRNAKGTPIMCVCVFSYICTYFYYSKNCTIFELSFSLVYCDSILDT